MLPLVSIVMPCHNAAAHLPASLGSVRAQTFADWELIAIDDGSTDGTADVLATQQDPRVRVISQQNCGVSAARTRALRECRADLVAFLDADDSWAPDFLEQMYGALRIRPDAVLAYCGWQNIGLPDKRGAPFVPPDYETPDKAEVLFAGCRWPIHAALVRKRAIEAAGGFDATLRNAEDFALWLEIASQAPIVRVPQILAYYHFHGGVQASTNRARAALHHLKAQSDYLSRHPELAAKLGRARVRELLYAELLRRGFDAYWDRDLPAAQAIFRRVMRAGFGRLRDLRYLLPALLPATAYRALLYRMDLAKSRPDTNAD